MERNIDNKSKDSISYYISRIPKTDDGICYQEYLLFKIRLLLERKELDSVFILLNILDKSLLNNYNKKVKGEQLFLKGRYHFNKKSDDSASYYYFKSLDHAKLLNDSILQIKLFNSISGVFANLSQHDKAMEYANIGLLMARQKRDRKSSILILGNLINTYGKQYLKTLDKKYLDSAESVSKRLVVEAKKEKNDYALLKAFSGLGSCYFQHKDYQKTLAYSDSIILFANKEKYPKVIMEAYGNISDSYWELGKFSLAKIAGDSALKYAQKRGDRQAVAEIYNKLYYCESELKNYERAIEYYQLYDITKDSISEEEKFTAVNELEQKYNKSENEKKINDLTKEQQISNLKINILIIATVLAVLLVALVIFIFRQRSLKQRQNLLETEQRLNRARINPHFFFNSITTLQGMALKENDGKKIFTHLFTFSKLMRETLENSYSDLVPIAQEIEFINNYIELQKLNQPEKFSFEVNVSDEINEKEIFIPSMILQPFIENAIEHGFSDMQSGGLITLSFTVDNSEIRITITDNGKGISNIVNKTKNYTSRAMQITNDRLLLINKVFKTNARFTLSSNTPEGTKAEIFLPLNLENESTGNR